MKAITFFIFIIVNQTGFGQTRDAQKLYQFKKDFKVVEDSIAKGINFQNTIIYKTCEGYRAFYFIQDKLHWTGYFIKNLLVDGLDSPTIVDTLKNGEIVKVEPYQTELLIYNADSIVKVLFNSHINDIQQITEKSIQEKFIKKGKKRNEEIVQSLPNISHECCGTITIYGQKSVSATFRGVLIDTEDIHVIPTLKIFHETKQVLISSTKNYDH